MNACDSITSVKLDEKLKTIVLSTTKRGKERFLTLPQYCVEEHGHNIFYYFMDAHNTVANLFDKVHNVTLNMIVIFCRSDQSYQPEQ
jgi:hypothetical protein